MLTRTAVYVLLAATLLGFIGTVLTGSEPGFLLGFCVIVGSVVAVLGVRRSAVHLILPLPALADFLAAVLAGAIHDRAIDTSTTELGTSFLQWTANVFFSMCVATILVVVIAGARWLFSRQLVSGQFATSADRPGGGGRRTAAAPRRGAGRDPRGARDNDRWTTADPWSNRDGPGGQRANRDERDTRDPWGDRRPPAGPSRPGNLPGGPNRPGNANPPGGALPPGGRNQPGGSGRPGDRGMPANRDPWGQRDQRDNRGAGNQPPRRDERPPRDPWGQR